MLDVSIKAKLWMDDLARTLRTRLAAEEGQTAAEYLGLIVVVFAIIGLIVQAKLGQDLAKFMHDRISDIAGLK